MTNPGYTGPTGPVSGNPPIDNLGTQAQAIAATDIDWNGIVNNNAAQPSITIPPGSWPSFSNPNYWPIIMLVGNTTLPGSGQGTLIVTGNLTINGNTTWNGVILVGGNLTSNGNNTVDGAVVTGLNVELGDGASKLARKREQDVPVQLVQRSQSDSGDERQLVGYTNAWVDNWNGY